MPPTLAAACPELVEAYAWTANRQRSARQSNPLEKVRWHLYKFSITAIKAYLLISEFGMDMITNTLADMEEDGDVPKIKLGDASCAAPFTSKLSNVSSSEQIGNLFISSLIVVH